MRSRRWPARRSEPTLGVGLLTCRKLQTANGVARRRGDEGEDQPLSHSEARTEVEKEKGEERPLTSTSVTRSLVVLPAASLPKVADGTELGPEGLAGVPPIRQVLDRRSRFELPLVSGVDVADEVVADIVADVELEEVAELGELAEYGVVSREVGPEKEATGELGQ